MSTNDLPLIEIGWIIASKLSSTDNDAVHQAKQRTEDLLQELFPQFRWSMPLITREIPSRERREEPIVLLDQAVIERNAQHWDYVLIITGIDLVSHYKSDALAVISRAFEAAVISTNRIQPRVSSPGEVDPVAIIAHRAHVLAMHSLGHLLGLDHDSDQDNYLYDFQTVEDLDHANQLTDSQKQSLAKELNRTSDLRLEEEPSARRSSRWVFYLRATWLNRSQLLDAILDAKPWEFPFRLNRLTATAFSSLVVLMITAELWDLALRQSTIQIVGLALISVLFTTCFVLLRQRLYVRRERPRLSEQTVVTNISTFAIVLLGMSTTFLLLMLTSFLLTWLIFPAQLITSWAPATQGALLSSHYFTLSTFVASIGIWIGSLGASFEQNAYFRHVTIVDEET